MKGQCLTKCGLDVDYEPIEFSDGFVYYLPRNLDGKHHNCIFGEDEGFFNYQDDSVEEFCQKHKERLNISVDSFVEIRGTYGAFEYIDIPMDDQFMDMVREGKLFELKKYVENELKMVTVPHLAHRSDFRWPQDNVLDIELKNATQQQIIGYTWIELPTNQGYQLEYLGKIYELMIRLEDAKKCYELQYECTGEPELKEYVEKLDKSIEEKNLRYPKNNNLSAEKLTRDTTLEILKKTEENVRKYIFGVYDNDVQEIWSRFPHHKKSVDERRQKNEKSLTPLEEKTPIQNLTMGQLSDIMFHSNNQRPSDRNDKCKKCGEKYLKKELIFFQNIKNSKDKIICKNKQCFESQGGLHKNVNEELVSLFQLLTSVRNMLTHAEKEDLKKDQTSWQIRFNSVAGECRLVNYHLEKINTDKQYA